jgi:acyl carrier protein
MCLQAGMDSLGAVELRNAMTTKFGITLPATIVFDFPSTRALATHVHKLLVPSQGEHQEVIA